MSTYSSASGAFCAPVTFAACLAIACAASACTPRPLPNDQLQQESRQPPGRIPPRNYWRTDYLGPVQLSALQTPINTGTIPPWYFGLNNAGAVSWTGPDYENPGIGARSSAYQLVPATGAQPVQVRAISDFQSKVSSSYAGGVNQSGVTAGYWWKQTGDIPPLPFTQSFVWRLGNSTPDSLATLSGSTNAQAFDINDGGQVVGYSVPQNGGMTATLWQSGTPSAMPSAIDILGSLNSQAIAINNVGSMVGGYIPSGGSDYYPFYRTVAGQVTTDFDMGPGVAKGFATDVNDSETVVGYSTLGALGTATGIKQQAWRWTNTQHTLPLFGLGFPNEQPSEAYSINKSGTIAGSSGWPGNPSQPRAVTWTNPTRNAYQATDVTAMVGSPGLILTHALKVNDNGDILCAGTGSSHGPGMYLVRWTGPRIAP